MQFQITEESHNRVAWEIDLPLLRLEIGLLIGLLVCVALVIILPAFRPFGWFLTGGVMTGIVGGMVYLALTTPLRERGLMERPPEGGVVRRDRQWIFGGEGTALEVPLDEVTGFTVEEQIFEETGGTTRTLARLWVLRQHVDPENEPTSELLTDWLEPETAQAFAVTLSQAARRPLTAWSE